MKNAPPAFPAPGQIKISEVLITPSGPSVSVPGKDKIRNGAVQLQPCRVARFPSVQIKLDVFRALHQFPAGPLFRLILLPLVLEKSISANCRCGSGLHQAKQRRNPRSPPSAVLLHHIECFVGISACQAGSPFLREKAKQGCYTLSTSRRLPCCRKTCSASR